MGRWADYLISEVKYDFKHQRIEKVKRHLDRGDGIPHPNIINRAIMVNDLIKGKKYKTIYRNEKGEWSPGNDVMFVEGSGIITVDPNKTDHDFLGELPEF